MHEYALMEALVAKVVEASRNAQAVRRVRVEIGELLAASREALEAAFKVLTQGTELEEALLEIGVVPGRVQCDACGFGGTAAQLDVVNLHEALPLLCPKCGSLLRVTEGGDIRLAEIEFGRDDEVRASRG